MTESEIVKKTIDCFKGTLQTQGNTLLSPEAKEMLKNINKSVAEKEYGNIEKIVNFAKNLFGYQTGAEKLRAFAGEIAGMQETGKNLNKLSVDLNNLVAIVNSKSSDTSSRILKSAADNDEKLNQIYDQINPESIEVNEKILNSYKNKLDEKWEEISNNTTNTPNQALQKIENTKEYKDFQSLKKFILEPNTIKPSDRKFVNELCFNCLKDIHQSKIEKILDGINNADPGILREDLKELVHESKLGKDGIGEQFKKDFTRAGYALSIQLERNTKDGITLEARDFISGGEDQLSKLKEYVGPANKNIHNFVYRIANTMHQSAIIPQKFNDLLLSNFCDISNPTWKLLAGLQPHQHQNTIIFNLDGSATIKRLDYMEIYNVDVKGIENPSSENLALPVLVRIEREMTLTKESVVRLNSPNEGDFLLEDLPVSLNLKICTVEEANKFIKADSDSKINMEIQKIKRQIREFSES